MDCKNTYLLSALVVALLFFVLIKPIHHKKTNSYMTNALNSEYKYGGATLRFNNDPSDMDYYDINLNNEELSVPNSQILTNKGLYRYASLLVPRSHTQLRAGSDHSQALKLSDGAHFSDFIAIRDDIKTYSPDNAFNRYGTVKESYFE